MLKSSLLPKTIDVPGSPSAPGCGVPPIAVVTSGAGKRPCRGKPITYSVRNQQWSRDCRAGTGWPWSSRSVAGCRYPGGGPPTKLISGSDGAGTTSVLDGVLDAAPGAAGAGISSPCPATLDPGAVLPALPVGVAGADGAGRAGVPAVGAAGLPG